MTAHLAFDLCTACSCHLKAHESACPFCGAPHVPRAPTAMRLGQRVSRAQWLAFGPLAFAGCTGHAQATHDAAPAVAPDANSFEDGATDRDAADQNATIVLDANTSDEGATAETAPDDAPMDGADAMADSSQDAAEYDVVAVEAAANQDAELDGGTQADATSCVRGARYEAASLLLCCNSATQYYEFCAVPPYCGTLCRDFGVTGCAASHTCACVGRGPTTFGPASCDEDDAGHVVAYVGPCYGAPPARRERLTVAAERQGPGGVS
jgi:hypothetical protein